MLDPKAIEKKWQLEWEKAKLFEANVQPEKPKFFITFPYPYLNGAMHVGHSYTFFRTEVYARYKRMRGFNVLFPQGFHATGEPIMGTVERLRKDDAAQIESFTRSGASAADIENFKKGPENVAKFWKEKWTRDLKAAGASIDWRRTFITTDLTPTYSRFIEWQYNTLRKKGFVVQGTHPVIYCPHDDSPTGDHDRYKGEGESPVEYTILKFDLQLNGEKIILPCATLRPETVYGATNLWLKPDAKYAKAKVDGQVWVLSEYAALKLKDQGHSVEKISEIAASELIGKKCMNPVLKNQVPILPAEFVSLDNATGVVMGVPAHAPYDFIALEDLKKDRAAMKRHNLSGPELQNIKPVSIISIEGYGEFPAADACSKLKISSQKDIEKLEDATSKIYKHEFHKGTLKTQFGKYAGLKVSEAKEELIAHFKSLGIASSIWEPTAEVICRCMTRCHVKILENQWFLKFSDKNWKSEVLQHLKRMFISPEEARLQLENTVEWLQNKACTRKSGLGTKLPWDKEWLIETLSDSTIYMAYYTIAKTINEHSVQPQQLPDEVFDFIFLSKGKPEDALKKTSLSRETILQMKSEFEYFYPVDLRNSGKDLLQNHLLFYLFHHAAIFSRKHQPPGIAVNGYVAVEGEKMSKSKGNFITARELLSEYGADLVRINIAAAGEGLDDADWRNETIKTHRKSLEFLRDTAMKLQGNYFEGPEYGRPEELLESTLNICIKNANENMEVLKFRSAIHSAEFEAINALKNYLQRARGNPALIKKSLGQITLMLAPFTPHFSEELWQSLGNSTFCSTARYPEADESKINYGLLEQEKYLENLKADLQRIIGLTNKKPQKLVIFTAPKWKWALLKLSLLRSTQEGKFDVPALIKEALGAPEFKPYSKELPAFLQVIGKAVNFYKSGSLPQFDEHQLLQELSPELQSQFKCEVEILAAEHATQENDPQHKASKALPLKPAIYLLGS